MPKMRQRELILLTNVAMKPHSLTIGGILPLNLDTFVKVIVAQIYIRLLRILSTYEYVNDYFFHFRYWKKCIHS